MTTSTTSTRPQHAQPVRLALLAVLGTLAALLLPAQVAHAANYQYWGYYQVVDGKWAFYQVGPDKSAPKDGAVEGWRWAVDDGTGATPRAPRALPTFTAVCDTTPAESGKKRVAVVLDYGRPADGDGKTTPPQPRAKCASVATAATGAEVLAAVAEVRMGGGLVCGLDGYPAAGCGGEVATLTDEQKAADTPVTIAPATAATPSSGGPTATDTASAAPAAAPAVSTSSSPPVGVWVGVLVVLLGIAVLLWSVRRRRQTAA
jgi:hypothetical protein